MNREEKRAKRRKLWKRRLAWLEKECKRNEAVNKFVAELKENFDDDEIEAAKIFSVDFLTHSGFYAEFMKAINLSDMEGINKIVRNYGLELPDGIFIVDMVEDIFPAEKGESNGRDG